MGRRVEGRPSVAVDISGSKLPLFPPCLRLNGSSSNRSNQCCQLSIEKWNDGKRGNFNPEILTATEGAPLVFSDFRIWLCKVGNTEKQPPCLLLLQVRFLAHVYSHLLFNGEHHQCCEKSYHSLHFSSLGVSFWNTSLLACKVTAHIIWSA